MQTATPPAIVQKIEMPPRAEKIKGPAFDKCAWENRIRRILKANNLHSGIKAFYYYKLYGSITTIVKIDDYKFEDQRVYETYFVIINEKDELHGIDTSTVDQGSNVLKYRRGSFRLMGCDSSGELWW
jgi:hypothetical protein